MRELFSEQTIETRVKQLAAEINADFAGKAPILIGVLNGSFIFMADLVREISIECEVDFIKISSYEGTSSQGTVHLLKDISADITGRDIIIVEDIVDSGLTMNFLMSRLEGAGPTTISVATLLFKKEVARLTFELDYVGFTISKDYVVGYGLDFDQKMRNLKGIYRLDGQQESEENG